MAAYFGGLFWYEGSKAERKVEHESVQMAVNDILQIACNERRLRLTGKQGYPYWIFPIWKPTNKRSLLIVIGDWAKYVGLEMELGFRFPEYQRIVVLYSEMDFVEEENEAVYEFIVNYVRRGLSRPED